MINGSRDFSALFSLFALQLISWPIEMGRKQENFKLERDIYLAKQKVPLSVTRTHKARTKQKKKMKRFFWLAVRFWMDDKDEQMTVDDDDVSYFVFNVI